MEIKILVKEHQKSDLENFINECEKQGFKITREGGGRLQNFSGYYAELKGERWQKADAGKSHCGLTEIEYVEREVLLEKQRSTTRWFSQQEFDRLKELSDKMFKNADSPHCG